MAESVWQRCSVQECLRSKFTHSAILYQCHPQLRLNKLQEDRLLVTDPKALQKIMNTSAYSYSKLPNLRVISRLLNGKGVLWAEGSSHPFKISFEMTTYQARTIDDKGTYCFQGLDRKSRKHSCRSSMIVLSL